jgi:hypothetical protein
MRNIFTENNVNLKKRIIVCNELTKIGGFLFTLVNPD